MKCHYNIFNFCISFTCDDKFLPPFFFFFLSASLSIFFFFFFFLHSPHSCLIFSFLVISYNTLHHFYLLDRFTFFISFFIFC